jgi:hypothetical protein
MMSSVVHAARVFVKDGSGDKMMPTEHSLCALPLR